uniref:Sfi1 spindle body domain-containing protein n=1 Tax=Biomphalaria glabrata TaxID=6526 RepID=A0A2C9LFF4_BIOGL
MPHQAVLVFVMPHQAVLVFVMSHWAVLVFVMPHWAILMFVMSHWAVSVVFVAWKNWAHERHKLMVRSQTLLQHRQTKLAFRKWCQRLEQNKKSELMHQQAWNNYLILILQSWQWWAKISRERRIRGLALKKALQERSLHIYFQYWVVMTRVKQSVQQNVETKLQIRIFKAWHIYTRRTCRLRELEALMSHRVNTRLLHNAFITLRWRAEYCTSLNEMADKVVHDREMATMRAVLVLWKERINNIQAKRCYRLLLTVRVVKRWHKFVTSRRLEHQRDEDNWSKAVRFYNKKLCKSVLVPVDYYENYQIG